MYAVNIRTREKKTDVSPELYGLFFEDINRAGDGGLYAEMLRNRAFDDGIVPEGCIYDSENKLIISPTGWRSSFDCCENEAVAGWSASDGASMSLTRQDTLNENRQRALCVCFNGGKISNEGFNGVPAEKGKSYRFYMFAKSEAYVTVLVKLESKDGEKYAEHKFDINGAYRKYECEFTSEATDFDARLVLSSESGENVTLGFVSLFPKDTFMERENGLRNDLVQKLLALNPSFLRFPGGCIVEGFSKQTAFRFKDTIGPVWERKPHWLLWSYMTTNGLGFHEYLQFCEDAGIDAMYVFNCGMTCQGRCPDYFDEQLVNEFFEDTVDAILYATAPTGTAWGDRRAANGHSEPFTVLKYLEIGNENWGDEYNKRYEFFYERLKKLFPQFVYISTDHTEQAGLKTEFVDEHFYADPVFFAANTKLYDSLDREGACIYCGEYASTIGCGEGTLYGALGEAAFLTGIERNQDKVKMTSYAPLLKNVGYVSWEPDMIVFNNHESYAIPSYYMLKMFAENRGDYVCGHSVATESDRRIEKGVFRVDGRKPVESRVIPKGCETDRDSLADGSLKKTGVGRFSAVFYGSDTIKIRFWDKGTEGENQDHYDWTAENGKSSVVHYNGWSKEIICAETLCEVSNGRNNVEIITAEDSFIICLNGKELHRHVLEPIPHMTVVCTVDMQKNEIITKLVNFSETEFKAEISCDRKMYDSAEMITLTADDYNACNGFDAPKAVTPYMESISASSHYYVKIKPRSINVIRHKITD